MGGHRIEDDGLGALEIPAEALYGVHAARARANFPLSGHRVHPALICAYADVKLACAAVNRQLGYLDENVFQAVAAACAELAAGDLDEHIVVDAMQGGAGTSTNMNVNEVLANRAIQKLGGVPGEYHLVDPLGHLNLHQSTNDTYPTALRVAAIRGLRALEAALVLLLEACQRKEKEFADVVKVGRTELRDAVLTTMGRGMSAYAEAFGRDRWRVFKAEERLRVVNLGGTAIGTGLAAPRRYIFAVADKLREITGIGLARAENLVDATQNADSFAEAAGIIAVCAANLKKCANDLRLMSSGPEAGLGELELPALQAGSSIMPGKINPVIPEAVVQCATAAMADCQVVVQACSMGELELNAFMPLIAERLLGALDLLANSARVLAERCVEGLRVDRVACAAKVDACTATVTALVERLGYEAARAIAAEAKASGRGIRAVVVGDGHLEAAEFESLISPEAVTKLGFH